MSGQDRDPPPWVRDLILQKGPRLLEAVGERAAPESAWAYHSHGATIQVESPHPGIFDRLVLVLPRPPDRPTDEFREWAEGRLARLDKYLQRTNLGRVLRQFPTEACVIASVAQRTGHDPGTPTGYFPPPEDLPRLLAGFVRDIEVYLRLIGDGGLRYVGGVRLFLVPRGADPPEWKLGIEVLDTVVGRQSETSALAPLVLVRAVIAEMVEIADVRALVFEGDRRAHRARRRSTQHYCRELTALATRAAQPGFMLTHVVRQLGEIAPPPKPKTNWVWAAVTGVALLASLWWWLL